MRSVVWSAVDSAPLSTRGTKSAHGRDGAQVNQSTLANAFADCAFWLYPTSFEETSCITAMKAQVASPGVAGPVVRVPLAVVLGGRPRAETAQLRAVALDYRSVLRRRMRSAFAWVALLTAAVLSCRCGRRCRGMGRRSERFVPYCSVLKGHVGRWVRGTEGGGGAMQYSLGCSSGDGSDSDHVAPSRFCSEQDLRPLRSRYRRAPAFSVQARNPAMCRASCAWCTD